MHVRTLSVNTALPLRLFIFSVPNNRVCVLLLLLILTLLLAHRLYSSLHGHKPGAQIILGEKVSMSQTSRINYRMLPPVAYSIRRTNVSPNVLDFFLVKTLGLGLLGLSLGLGFAVVESTLDINSNGCCMLWLA